MAADDFDAIARRRLVTRGLVGNHTRLYQTSAGYSVFVDQLAEVLVTLGDVMAEQAQAADANLAQAMEAMRRIPSPTIILATDHGPVDPGSDPGALVVQQAADVYRLLVELVGHTEVPCRIRHAVFLGGGRGPCEGCACACHQPHDFVTHDSVQADGPGPCQVCGGRYLDDGDPPGPHYAAAPKAPTPRPPGPGFPS